MVGDYKKYTAAEWREYYEHCRETDTRMQAEEWQFFYTQIYLPSEHWQKTKLIAMCRNGGQCQLCGSCEDLAQHHTTYKFLYCENVEIDLVTLCDICHARQHIKYKRLWHSMIYCPWILMGYKAQENRYVENGI